MSLAKRFAKKRWGEEPIEEVPTTSSPTLAKPPQVKFIDAQARRDFLRRLGIGGALVGGALALGRLSSGVKGFGSPPTGSVIAKDYLSLAPGASRPSGIPQGGLWIKTDETVQMYNGTTDLLVGPGSSAPPTGTGFRHVTAGVEDAASKLVDTADVNNNQVTYAKMQDISATDRFLGRKTAAAGDPEELTGTEATARLDVFTSILKGLVPVSGGGTTNFLRADATFAAPPSGGTPPTGTGFRHITAGVEDAASKLVDTADINANQITNDKLAQMAANTIKANVGLFSDPEDLAVGASTVIGRGATGDIVAAALETSQVANNAVDNTKIVDMAANTVKANATAGTADPADLAVGTNTVVGRAAGNIVAAQVATGQIAANAVDNTIIRDGAATSVIGRASGTIGDPADIAASVDGQYLSRAAGALAFAAIPAGDLPAHGAAQHTGDVIPAASFATPAILLGSSPAAGAASTVIRSDSTIAAFDVTAPTNSALGDSAGVGTAAFASRRDHLHGREAFGTNPANSILGTTAGSGGSATTPAKSDHAHGITAFTFIIGITIKVPAGADDIFIWEAPFACTVTNIRGYQNLGTGSTFNAFRGTLAAPTLFLASNATVGTADSIQDGGSVQNTAVSSGDKLYARLAGVSGSPDKVAILLRLTRP